MLPRKLACAVTCCSLILATTVRSEAVPDPASAEGESLLRVGARVRLNQSIRKMPTLTGRVLSLDDHSLLLEVREGAEPLKVNRSEIQSLEIAMGRRTQAGKGALIGGIGLGVPGLLLGGLAGAYGASECYRNCGGSSILPAALVVGALAGGVGAGLGALVGSAFRTDDWQTPRPQRVSAYVMPTRRGVAASLTFKF